MHELTEWNDRDDELVGASLFLTAEEVKEAREQGSVEIEIDQS
jgi:hypothetical protein